MQPEKIIENQILNYLLSKKVFCWKVKTTASYDPRRGRFLKTSSLYKKGVADILGIFKGKPLAIEVKTPTGRLSPEQRDFLTEFREQGGIAFIARSVDDIELKLFSKE